MILINKLSPEKLIYSPGKCNEQFSVVITVSDFCETFKIEIPLLIFAVWVIVHKRLTLPDW